MKTVSTDRNKCLTIFLFISLSLLYPPDLSAQDHQIQARIVDAFSNLPVPFVTVKTKSGSVIITDEMGFFRFHSGDVQTEDSLYLTCIGYHPGVAAPGDLHPNRLDTLRLSQNLLAWEEASFELKPSRAPGSRKIINQAFGAIPENYPGSPVQYRGYYREYVRQGNRTLNLLEGILNLSDQGIHTADDFSAGILYKRINPDFETDERVLHSGENELVVLRNCDPFRNYDQPAIKTIDHLNPKFDKKYAFDTPRVTFLEGRSYYAISFVDNKPPGRNGLDLEAEGILFIDTQNFGIKRLDYTGFARSGVNRKKLFGLSLEYNLVDGDYYLNYLSFNNLFMIADTTDAGGNPLENTRYREYSQYRELFVRDFQTRETLIALNLMDKRKPVFENQVFGDRYADTMWLNTPLPGEDTIKGMIHSENHSFQTGIENLLYRNEKTINDVVYLHTDREVYAPADTLWFKAYVRDLWKLEKTARSKTLFVKLVDGRGVEMNSGRFFIENSDARGQFTLGHKLEEGVYYLSAFTSWMQNYEPDQLYVKKILVRNERRESLQMVASFDRSSYFKGDTIRATIHCYDAQNRDVENVNYTFQVLAVETPMTRKQTRTTQSFSDTIEFILPDRFTGGATIQITGNHKGEPLDTAYRIPAVHAVHIDFFPEGGQSINTLESKIAFKAQTLQGDPIRIAGQIIEQDGNLVTTAETEHDGMGSFSVTPRQGHPMFFKPTYPPGIDKLYPIPGGVEKGWQLSGTSNRDSITLLVKRKDTPDEFALITVMVRGYLAYYQQIRVDHSTSVKIPLAGLPPGIAVVTLLDQQMKPRAERLLYVHPKGEVGINMETDRHTYIPRDKVSLDIQLDPGKIERLKGSFSLSVVDDQLGLADFIQEAGLRSSFLISPEIKGTIHHPDYYLGNDPGVQNHLDLLLMTQGWRNYSYLEEDWEYQVMPPRDMEVVSGTLLRQPFGKDPRPAAGEVNVFYGGTSVHIPVSQNGRFQFTPEYDPDYNSGVLVSAKPGGAGMAIVQLDSPAFQENYSTSLYALLDSLEKASYMPVFPYRSVADQFSLGLTYFEWIDEVEIVKSGIRPDEELNSMLEDFIIHNKTEAEPVNIAEAGSLIDIFFNMGVPVEENLEDDQLIHIMYPRSVIGWVVDGFYYGTEFKDVSYISPSQIDKFYIIKHTETMYYGSRAPEVVVSIKLKKYKPEEQIPGLYQSKFNIPKFTVAREFYVPLYDTEVKRKTTVPDLRKTIYWDPFLKFGADGKAHVEFYNGDRYTNIRCILEGITDDGVPVYSEFSYNVSLSRN